MFESIRIVLVETSHPGNIGSTARAMKTMGFGSLYLVAPHQFPDRRATDMAAGADDILEQAIIVPSVSDAIADCDLVLGTSARPRDIDLPGLNPKEQAELISNRPSDAKVAILFGREHAGLTNDELLHCHYHINIPSHSEFSSLNLAQAVQIVVYELRMRLLSPKAKVRTNDAKYATAHEIEGFYQHLKEVLTEISFLKPSNPKRLMQRLKRLYNRAKLEQVEVNILRGTLTHIQKIIEQAKDNSKRE